MGKGIKGLSYLPQIDITNIAGDTCSINAYRSILYKIQYLQANIQEDQTLTSEPCQSNQPYYNSIWDITSSGAVAATATITLASVAIDDTVTINGQVFTAAAVADVANGIFSQASTDTADASSFILAVNSDTRPGNLSVIVTASSIAAVVTITADATGTDGNNITISSSSATTLALSVVQGHLTGGLNPDTYLVDFVSEVRPLIDTINPPGLSTKRLLDIAFTGASFPFTIRSVLSVLDWIEDTLEVHVSSAGSDIAVAASGTITCVGGLAGDTVTVNGLEYTAVAGAKADDSQFSIDTGDTETATDLADSIDDDTRTGTLLDVSGASVAGVVTVTCTTTVGGGNRITLASSNALRFALSAATLSGATDPGIGANGTHTLPIFRGATPYEQFIWATVVKAATVYTLTPGADS
jgi:hypothetical protein